MNLESATVGDIVDRLRELFEADRGAASTEALLEAAATWEQLGVVADAARTWVAAEIDHASRRQLGADGLAHRHGFSSGKKLIASAANVSERTATSRVQLGRQVRSNVSLSGLPCPSRFPVVEQAFFAGAIGADAASAICRTLSEVAARTTFNEKVDEAERHLVRVATATIPQAEPQPHGETASAGPGATPRLYTVDEIGRLAMRIRENLDPDGAEPRDAAKQQLRGFSHPRVGSDGMARGRYALPPLQLGTFLAAVDSILSPRTAEPDSPQLSEKVDHGASDARGTTGEPEARRAQLRTETPRRRDDTHRDGG